MRLYLVDGFLCYYLRGLDCLWYYVDKGKIFKNIKYFKNIVIKRLGRIILKL